LLLERITTLFDISRIRILVRQVRLSAMITGWLSLYTVVQNFRTKPSFAVSLRRTSTTGRKSVRSSTTSIKRIRLYSLKLFRSRREPCYLRILCYRQDFRDFPLPFRGREKTRANSPAKISRGLFTVAGPGHSLEPRAHNLLRRYTCQ